MGDRTAQGRTQPPIVLDEWSEPEPDVIVCECDPHRYAREHPRPEQILLVAEVAVSSLAYDREGERLPTPVGASVAVDDILLPR